MPITKYKYNAGRMFFDTALLFILTIFICASMSNQQPSQQSWLVLGLVLLLPAGRFIYLTITYFIPCLQNKIALQLDDEKLQLFITGKLLFQIPRDRAYWKDITGVDYTDPPRGSAIISFKMKDGSAFGFRTAYIAGNSADIYNTIMQYYNSQA
jgi:hypothetical protein